MKSIISPFLTGAVLTVMIVPAAAQSSPASGSFRVAEAGSCQGWFGTCLSRCSTQKALNCDKAFCSRKFESCRQSGCWTEGRAFGNAQHCGLQK